MLVLPAMCANDRLAVGVLMGGTSSEHDVSVNSGLNVCDALDAARFAVTPVLIDRAGGWHFGSRPAAPSLEVDATAVGGGTLLDDDPAVDDPYERLRHGAFDIVFIALHGPGGEDGAVQGMLTFAGVPYTGSGVLASALAMDKVRTKRLLQAEGVPLAPDARVGRGRVGTELEVGRVVDELVATIGLPCVVKPVSGGSSFGTAIVTDPTALAPALQAALQEDDAALVERFIAGVEVTCGVLGGGDGEPAEALPLTEIVPVGATFFDFRAKYTVGACDEITPARVPTAVGARVQELALLAHRTIGCEGMSRSDFIVGDEGPILLETNTIPGMTRTSLLPQGAAAAGIGFAQLVERLLRSGLRRAGRSWPWD